MTEKICFSHLQIHNIINKKSKSNKRNHILKKSASLLLPNKICLNTSRNCHIYYAKINLYLTKNEVSIGYLYM